MFTKEDRFFQIVNYLMENRKIYNQSDLANLLCIDKSYITNIKNGKKPVTDTIADKLVETFPETNREWLMDGKGQMLNVPDADAPSPACGGRSAALIPLIPIEAVAGFRTEENRGVRCESATGTWSDFDRLGRSSSSGQRIVDASTATERAGVQEGEGDTVLPVGQDLCRGQFARGAGQRIFEDSSNPTTSSREREQEKCSVQHPKSDIQGLSVVVGVVRMK